MFRTRATNLTEDAKAGIILVELSDDDGDDDDDDGSLELTGRVLKKKRKLLCKARDNEGAIATPQISAERSSTLDEEFRAWKTKGADSHGAAVFPLRKSKKTYYVRCRAASAVSPVLKVRGIKKRKRKKAR